MDAREYDEMKAAIKALFDLLTYEEQEEIIEIIKKHRQNSDR